MSTEEFEGGRRVRVPKARLMRDTIFNSIYENLRTAYWKFERFRDFFKQSSGLRRLALAITKDRDAQPVAESAPSIMNLVLELISEDSPGMRPRHHAINGLPKLSESILELPTLHSRTEVFFSDVQQRSHIISDPMASLLDKISWSFPKFSVNRKKSAIHELQPNLVGLTDHEFPDGKALRPAPFKQELSNYCATAAKYLDGGCRFSDGLRLSVKIYRLIDMAVGKIDNAPEYKMPATPTQNFRVNLMRAEKLVASQPSLKTASITHFRKKLGGNFEDARKIYDEFVKRGTIVPPGSSTKRRCHD